MKTKLKSIATIILSSALSACGGGVSVASNDGITGTGITTAGRVTGFGSIWVNGIEFNVNKATFSRDGVTSSGQSDFSIGEYVVIKGLVDQTTQSGIAEDVSFTDLLDGTVTTASTDNSTIEILGQLVTTDTKTILIDERGDSKNTLPNLTDLVLGNIVEVSGIRDSTGLIKATSIKLKKDIGSNNELKGTVINIDTSAKTFTIGSILVDYGTAKLEGFHTNPVNGQFVEVNSSTEYDGGILIAKKIELKDEHLVTEQGTELKLEGIVTRFISTLDFDINGIPVMTNSKTEYKDGVSTDIKLNVQLEVNGVVNNKGILIAKKIELKKEDVKDNGKESDGGDVSGGESASDGENTSNDENAGNGGESEQNEN